MENTSLITEVIKKHRQEIADAITSEMQFIIVYKTKKDDKFIRRFQFLAGISGRDEAELSTKARKQAESMAGREETFILYRIQEVA